MGINGQQCSQFKYIHRHIGKQVIFHVNMDWVIINIQTAFTIAIQKLL